MSRSGTRRLIVAVGCLAALGFAGYTAFRARVNPPSVLAPQRSAEEVRAAIEQHILEATERMRRGVTVRAEQLDSYIRERKSSGLTEFSKEVTSYRSSWLVIKSKLPFTDADEHRRFVSETFDRRLFTPAQLNAQVTMIVRAFEKDLQEEQNRLAVQIRQEISGNTPLLSDPSAARHDMELAVAAAAGSAHSGAATQAGQLVVSETVSAITTQVLVRLSVTGGLLGAGAASSWWTLGAGLAIGLAVDAAVRHVKNPQEDVHKEVERALDELAVRGKESLRQELERAVSERSMVWREVAKGMH